MVNSPSSTSNLSKERAIIYYEASNNKRYYLMGVNGVTDDFTNESRNKTISFLGGWKNCGENKGECILREIVEETIFLLSPEKERVIPLFEEEGVSYYEYKLNKDEFQKLRKEYSTSFRKIGEEISILLKKGDDILPFEREILKQYQSFFEVVLIFVSDDDMKRLYSRKKVGIRNFPYLLRISKNSLDGMNYLFSESDHPNENYFSVLLEN